VSKYGDTSKIGFCNIDSKPSNSKKYSKITGSRNEKETTGYLKRV